MKFVSALSATALLLLAMASCQKKMTDVKSEATAAAEKKLLNSQTDSLSYSLGMLLGQNIKQEGFDSLNLNVLTTALTDMLNDSTPALSQQDAQMVFQQYMMAKQAAEQAQNQVQYQTKIAEEQAFLEKNKQEPNVTTTQSGLQYTKLTEGTGKSPSATSTVKVHYEGRLLNGEIFDSSIQRGQPAEFPVNRVIPGWTEALQLMKEGGKMKVWVPHTLGYGAQGAGQQIKPYSTLVFEIELLEVL